VDAPRRWQVASIATAVAGLSLGGVMLGRSPSTAVPSIDLEVPADASAPTGVLEDRPGGSTELELVPPSVLEGPSAVTQDSVASPAEPPGPEDGGGLPTPDDGPSAPPEREASVSSEREPTPAPGPAPVASPASVDSPSSVDSAE
jgi:hypothetical protein